MTTKTLLDGVNDTLIRLKIINSSQRLASFTFPADQHAVDLAKQIWQATTDQLYALSDTSRPIEMSETSIVLVEDIRDYQLPVDLVQIQWPLQNQSEGRFIRHFDPGYNVLINSQNEPDNWKGQPRFGVIRPTDGFLWLDRIPTSSEDGLVYTLRYDREFILEAETDVFPFPSLNVYTAMRDTVSELYRLDADQQARPTITRAFALAAKALRQSPSRKHY